jgi:hypothetical protein
VALAPFTDGVLTLRAIPADSEEEDTDASPPALGTGNLWRPS